MMREKLCWLLVFTAVALLCSNPAFADNKFRSRFDNNSGTKVKASILKTDGSLQKDHGVNPDNHWTFDYGISSCRTTKVRQFQVHESQFDVLIASGKFTMETTRSESDGGCKRRIFTFDSCVDADANDAFDVSCRTNGYRKGWITID